MKTSERLQPLFNIVNKIHCDTDIKLNFEVCLYPSGWKHIVCYIGSPGTGIPEWGSFVDGIGTGDLDEDKLDAWVEELTGLYYIEMGWPVEDVTSNEESIAEEHRAENAVLDQQELVHDRRERT